MKRLFALNKIEKTYFVFLTALSILYVLPIILANRYYNDDLARSFSGATGWRGDGRPLTESLLLFLCGDKGCIIDIAPLPLIISVIILSYSLILYAKENLGFFEWNYILLYALFLVLANPFMLANLSYRYDCISMLSSMALLFVLFAMHNYVSEFVLFIASILCSIMMMAMYQATLGIALGMFCISIFLWLIGEKGSLKKDIFRISGLVGGALLYVIFIAPFLISKDDWRYEASQIVPWRLESIKQVLVNYYVIIRSIMTNLFEIGRLYKAAFGVMFFLAFVNMICVLYKKGKFKRAIGGVILAILGVVLSALPLAVLQNVPLGHRRLLFFSVITLALGILVLLLAEKNKTVVTILMIPCILFHFSYIYAYGNALSSQKEYEIYMVHNIAHDIETINCDREYEKITFIGTMPRSRQLQMICDKYPSFSSLVPVYFNNSGWIGGVWLQMYLQDGLGLEEPSEEEIILVKTDQPVIDNSIYKCFVNDNRIIVLFEDP